MLGASSCCRVFQELGVGDRGFSELGQEVIRDTESRARRCDRVNGEESKVGSLLIWQRDTLKGGVGEAGS